MTSEHMEEVAAGWSSAGAELVAVVKRRHQNPTKTGKGCIGEEDKFVVRRERKKKEERKKKRGMGK